MAEHLRACQQRPTTCTAAAKRPRSESLPSAHSSSSAPIECLFSWALDEEEEEEEEGGRRRRQRIGPAPHDAPPSDASMAVMGMAEATAALREHVTVARVAEVACLRLGNLAMGVGEFSEPLQRQGVTAVVEAMQAHPQVATVQNAGCFALDTLTKALSSAGQQAAAETGAIEAALNAMQAHLQNMQVQMTGLYALKSLCCGYEAAMLRAAEAGALQVAVAAMRSHPQDCGVQLAGAVTLRDYCQGDANKRQATEVGGRAVAFAAMQEFPGDNVIQITAQHLLAVLPPPK